MKKNLNLLEASITKLALRYLTTSVAGMVMISLYILFDTIIVGQGVGKDGLAALNIALPVFNLLFGTGLLLGTGGAAAIAISLGEGKREQAERTFRHAVLFAIALGAVYTALGMIFMEPIAYILGAGEKTMPLIKQYLGAIMPFCWSFVLVYCLSNIVRNDHGPRRVMLAMGAGGVTNVVLDYIFVFPLQMGMRGAAAATSISSLVSLVILLLHFVGGHSDFKMKLEKPEWSYAGRILKIGIPSFITELSSGIVIMMFNKEILSLVGDIGVTAYSIIANVSLMAMAVFSGIAQGVQPIASINFGAGKNSRTNSIAKVGVITAVCMGAVFTAAGLVFPEIIVSLFTAEKGQILDITKMGMQYYFLAFPLMGINVVMGAFFQAIERAKSSTAVVLCRGVLFTALILKLLSYVYGLKGVWLTVPAAELATMALIVVPFLLKYRAQSVES